MILPTFGLTLGDAAILAGLALLLALAAAAATWPPGPAA